MLGFSSIFTGLNFIATVHKLRAPGMGWFDMPLFVWGIYSTAIIQVLATPVLGITLVLLMLERGLRHRHFRSAHRRRSGAVPALLLVLLAPGRVHHDSAGHGDHQRTDPDVFAQDHLRLPRHRLFQRFAGAGELHRVGPSHVRGRPVATGHGDFFGADVPGRDSVRRQGVQLAGHHV